MISHVKISSQGHINAQNFINNKFKTGIFSVKLFILFIIKIFKLNPISRKKKFHYHAYLLLLWVKWRIASSIKKRLGLNCFQFPKNPNWKLICLTRICCHLDNFKFGWKLCSLHFTNKSIPTFVCSSLASISVTYCKWLGFGYLYALFWFAILLVGSLCWTIILYMQGVC